MAAMILRKNFLGHLKMRRRLWPRALMTAAPVMAAA